MRPRFLIVAAREPGTVESIRSNITRARFDGHAMQVALERDHLLVLASGEPPLAVGADGALIGSIFMRGRTGAVTTLRRAEQDAIVSTRGGWLINACWGGFVAVLGNASGSTVHIVRAPLGDLPCYIVRSRDALLCASDLSLLMASGQFTQSIDPAALVRHLAADDIRRPETCLSALSELPGGERLSVDDGDITQEAIWSPWTFAAPARQIVDPGEAERRIRDAAQHCVAARAAGAGTVLLKLSGGLDSSIVGACLAGARHPFSCLTLVTYDPAGDEREHARLVAQALGAQLTETYRDVTRIELARSAAARLPRPTARSFTQESARIASQASVQVGASAVFDGGGGDNVFCSLQSARAAADCLMSEAGQGRFWPTAAGVAQVARSSIWSVARRAWSISRRRSPNYHWPVDIRFLSPEACNESSGATAHPWLDPPPGTLPGKAAHVALVTAAQSVAEGFDVEDPLPHHSPLISQPLVEACLQVPSWLWFEGGNNRSVARRAFAAQLPAATIQRRSKGAPDGFLAEIYEANRTQIRSLLMDGLLRKHGLLDTDALTSMLDDPAPVCGHDFLRVLQLVDAEAWARSSS